MAENQKEEKTLEEAFSELDVLADSQGFSPGCQFFFL